MDRPAKKTDFQTPGSYATLPLAVMQNAALTPAAKLVYAAMLDCLRGGDEYVYPTAGHLQRMTACGRSTVLKAIEQLEAEGLITRDRQPGTRTLYAFARMPTGIKNKPVAEESGERTGPKKKPVIAKSGIKNKPVEGESGGMAGIKSKPVITESGIKTKPVSISDPSENETGVVSKSDGGGLLSGPRSMEETPTRNNDKKQPPIPPASGGQASEFSCETENGDGLPPATDLDAAIERVRTAWRQVFGREPDRKTLLRAKREFKRGDRASVAEIDASAIRAARQRAEQAKCTFGFQWVLNVLQERAATRLASEAARRTIGEQQRGAVFSGANEQAEREEREREAAAYFARLDEPTRESYRAKANDGPLKIKRPDLLERLAAALAFNERPATA